MLLAELRSQREDVRQGLMALVETLVEWVGLVWAGKRWGWTAVAQEWRSGAGQLHYMQQMVADLAQVMNLAEEAAFPTQAEGSE